MGFGEFCGGNLSSVLAICHFVSAAFDFGVFIVKVATTEIEWDFILDKDKLSPTELQERFAVCNGSSLFVKDVCDNPASVSFSRKDEQQLLPLDDFGMRLGLLRQFLQDLAVPRMKEIFRVQAAAFDHGLENCRTHDQFLDAFRTLPYNNNMRQIAFHLMGPMWGKFWAPEVEKMIMNKTKLKYKNLLVCGEAPKTRRTKGCVNTIIMRTRQSRLVDPFRFVSEVCFACLLAHLFAEVCCSL